MRREIEEGEGVLFKEKFFNWSSTLPIQMQQIASGKNVAGSLPHLPGLYQAKASPRCACAVVCVR
jgi:hypothetical protein